MFVEPQLAHERGSGCQRDSAAAVHYKLLVGTERPLKKLLGIYYYLREAALAFWLTWRSLGDPRL